MNAPVKKRDIYDTAHFHVLFYYKDSIIVSMASV